MCEVASWIPTAVTSTLCADRSAQPIIAWLTVIRGVTEEYDPLVTVRPPTPGSDTSTPGSDTSTTTPDSAFDEILSQLGNEIYKLNEYQQYLSPEEQQVSLSILNIFDECLEEMTVLTPETIVNCEVSASVVADIEENRTAPDGVEVLHSVSDNCCETLTDVSFVTSTPCKSDRMQPNDVPAKQNNDSVVPPPVPPRRTRLKTSSHCDNMDSEDVAKLIESDSDSESTCWSYKECSTDADNESQDRYAAVWSHSSGYHNSDEILRRVLSQNHASVSRVTFDTASEFTLSQYPVYALREVGEDRCVDTAPAVADMTPDKLLDDGYEPVRDALTLDENIYEEIEYGCSFTDEGCSCGGSVEVESCSISASSEGVGRESPMYANLRDHDAYAVPPDVIFWKNLLSHPFYNDDEEDEWITPEECEVYSREQRPPFVIPRIPQYRTPRYQPHGHSYTEDTFKEPSLGKRNDWSPSSERGRQDLERSFSKANSDSPPFNRINKRLGGSTENLLVNLRRPTHLNLPASSSGDSLDVEVRETKTPQRRNAKSKSLITPKLRMRSPVPAPRLHQPAETPIILDGPVKRTKFTDNGKKVRKNWMDCYMILTPTALLFYKDQKSYHSTLQLKQSPVAAAARVELVLALRHAHVVLAKQMHTRRYTRSLVVEVDYDEYLVQVDTEEAAKRLLNCIQNVIYSLGPPTVEEYPPKYQSSTTDLESLGRTPPVSRHNQRSKQKVGGSSNEDLSDSTEVNKSHVRSRLKKFFAKRPAMEVLVKKGIYKDEPVFGRFLEVVCPATSPRVPEFVVACVKEIEANEENMCTDGLYRASGNLSQVQKIRLEIDQNNMSVIENNSDIHVLTSSLKLFFRELKEPLIPCSMFERVLAACSIKPKEAKIKEFRDIVNSLPQCNRETLKFLLEHLLRVTKYSEKNRMHTANLAIVFGPTLLWAPEEQAHRIAIDCIQQNNVVDILLTEFKQIFTEDTIGKKKS